MKLVQKSLLATLIIFAALSLLQGVLSLFGNYTVAIIFYFATVFLSASSAIVFNECLGIDLRENQFLFLFVVIAEMYLVVAFFIYLLLLLIKRIKLSNLK